MILSKSPSKDQVWKKRFAFFPVHFFDSQGKEAILWLESYEYRSYPWKIRFKDGTERDMVTTYEGY